MDVAPTRLRSEIEERRAVTLTLAIDVATAIGWLLRRWGAR
jgi:hypothetical protein